VQASFWPSPSVSTLLQGRNGVCALYRVVPQSSSAPSLPGPETAVFGC
jgi:hypothetical protein